MTLPGGTRYKPHVRHFFPELKAEDFCPQDRIFKGPVNVRVSLLWKGLSMADSREVMNIRQASQYLGVSTDTLYKYVYEEKIPAFKLGNRWKFKKTILDSWMERKSMGGEDKGKKRPKAARAAAGGQRQTI